MSKSLHGLMKWLKKNDPIQYSDEYIDRHWQELIHQGLLHYGYYYKSEQYYLDRGVVRLKIV